MAAPESVAEVRGWESRASIWVGLVGAAVLVVVCEVEEGCCCWLVAAVGWGGEGSAGGVSGCEGELAGGARVAGEAMIVGCGGCERVREWR